MTRGKSSLLFIVFKIITQRVLGSTDRDKCSMKIIAVLNVASQILYNILTRKVGNEKMTIRHEAEKTRRIYVSIYVATQWMGKSFVYVYEYNVFDLSKRSIYTYICSVVAHNSFCLAHLEPKGNNKSSEEIQITVVTVCKITLSGNGICMFSPIGMYNLNLNRGK